ncbi:class I SAM-dependent methyltransferase [Arundinibacter roseus]|uniref:Class I SAM-dependent methyltransferase n=1 Tax=Arundinibacter roseus TaxID=2070510 RepID=A0A4R4K9K0_9BACT|nr:class I SAM-dependent methyltransferase [Arundinibacter roseus]TDB64203.1 class I SAM-dependent methyltransferase [Arundinibacter roseus]
MAWYHTFFEGLPQIAWKQNQEEDQTEWEVDFLQDVLEISPGEQVLDVMAGYGRHALPLARRGFVMTGVDISAEYCEEFEQVAQVEILPVTVVQSDFLAIDLPHTPFDAAYCLGNSFSFFPREIMIDFLQKISEHIKPGGRFVAHTQLLAESILPNFQERSWMPVGQDILYLTSNQYDAMKGVILSELTYVKGREQMTRQVEQYVYSLSEVHALFQQAGLHLTEVFGSLDGEPFALGDEQAYLLATKTS